LTNVLLAGFGTEGFRREEAMKTADRENPKRWATTPANRANGAAGQNRSCSFKGAAKEEKLQPQGRFFLLTSTFIELTRQVRNAPMRLTKSLGKPPINQSCGASDG